MLRGMCVTKSRFLWGQHTEPAESIGLISNLLLVVPEGLALAGLGSPSHFVTINMMF